MDGATLRHLIGLGLVGNDGSTFTAKALLVGNDGATLIGNDGATLKNRN